MEGIFRHESIKEIVKHVYDNNTIIKDINFDMDIDMANSGRILHDEKGIKYLGELREFENLSECIKVHGEFKIEDKAITFLGQENGISRIMLNKTFEEDLFYFSIR
jgi:hypothetical protein